MNNEKYGDFESFTFYATQVARLNARGVSLIGMPANFVLRWETDGFRIKEVSTEWVANGNPGGGSQQVLKNTSFKVTEPEVIYALDNKQFARVGTSDQLEQPERTPKRKKKAKRNATKKP